MIDHKNYFTVTRKNASLIVGILVVFSCIIFTAGYFWGYKKATQELCYRLDQDSLADQIYSSLCTWSESKYENDNEETDTGEMEDDVCEK